MAPKPTPAAVAEGEDGPQVQAEPHRTVTLGDTATMKLFLDDTLVLCLQQDHDYEEAVFWSNIKLLLMTIAAGLAALAHFYPAPFPENKEVLTWCAGGFFAINVLLYVVAVVVDKDYIAELVLGTPDEAKLAAREEARQQREAKGKRSGGAKGKSSGSTPTLKLPSNLKVRTDLPRYSDEYTMVLENDKGETLAEEMYSVGEFFTEKGEYAEDRFWATLDEFLARAFGKGGKTE